MNGIIYVEGNNEGKAFHQLFSYFSTIPENIVFVHDMQYNLNDITQVFNNNTNFPALKKLFYVIIGMSIPTREYLVKTLLNF